MTFCCFPYFYYAYAFLKEFQLKFKFKYLFSSKKSQRFIMFAYLLLFASCTLTILYNTNSHQEPTFNLANSTKYNTNDESVPPVAFWSSVDHFSARVSAYLDFLRSQLEDKLVNSTRNGVNLPVTLLEHARTAAPLYPLITYTIACYLIIQRRPNQNMLASTCIWILSIALILLNYER